VKSYQKYFHWGKSNPEKVARSIYLGKSSQKCFIREKVARNIYIGENLARNILIREKVVRNIFIR